MKKFADSVPSISSFLDLVNFRFWEKHRFSNISELHIYLKCHVKASEESFGTFSQIQLFLNR